MSMRSILVILIAQPTSKLPSAVWAVPHLRKQALHATMETEPISFCLSHVPWSRAQLCVLGFASQMFLRPWTQGHPLCGSFGSFSKNGSQGQQQWQRW